MSTSRQFTQTANAGATFVTAAVRIEHTTRFSVVGLIAGGGTPVGTIVVQGSNNAFMESGTEVENPNATWGEIAGSSKSITNDGVFVYNTSDAAFRAYRLSYTRTSGTGTVTLFSNIKGT
jgi:hypothetical protein